MKKTITLLIFVLIQKLMFGQTGCISTDPNSPACNDVISTDPRNPSNTERANMENNFNWMDDVITVYHLDGGAYNNGVGNPIEMLNPFFTEHEYLNHINFFNLNEEDETPEALDFHPEDGWELIKKHNGLQQNEVDVVSTADNRVGPYFILYNKYTSVIRVFGALANIGDKTIEIIIKYSNNSGKTYSGVLGRYTGKMDALDKNTKVIKVAQGADATIAGRFFTADFKAYYDPCICENRQSFVFDFDSKTDGTISLEGRLIATEVPLDGTGNSPLLNGRDFLNAVYLDDFTVNGGMQTYNNIDALVERFKTPETGLLEGLAMDAFGIVLDKASGKLDDMLGDVASKLLTRDFGGQEVFPGVTLQDTLSVSMGVVGSLADQFSSGLFSKPTIPNISFIEGEMVMSGTVEHTSGLGAVDFELAVPGSKYTNNSYYTNDKHYPVYNEALGTFALLETPMVKLDDASYIEKEWWQDPSTGWWEEREYVVASYRFQFDKESFNYYFNPVVDVNYDNTRIYGALTFKCSGYGADDALVTGANVKHRGETILYAITDFFPIESLNRNVVTITEFNDYDDIEVYLRIQVFSEYNANKYNQVNTSYDIYTFNTEFDIIDTEVDNDPLLESDLNSIPESVTIGNSTIAGDKVIKALNNIELNGVVNNTGKLTLLAKNSIKLNNGTKLLANVSLDTYNFKNEFDDVRLAQVDAAYVKSFCSSKYKANVLDPSLKRAMVDTVVKTQNDTTKNKAKPKSKHKTYSNTKTPTDIVIYPNPANNYLYIKGGDFNINEEINITIYNLAGQKVYAETISNITYLNNKLNLANYKAGVFYINIASKRNTIKEKLIIQ